MTNPVRSFHDMHAQFKKWGVETLAEMVETSVASDNPVNQDRIRSLWELQPEVCDLLQDPVKRAEEARNLFYLMSFHKHVELYERAGIINEHQMLSMSTGGRLSELGVGSSDAEDYAKLGFTEEEMVELHDGNVNGNDAKKLSGWGFKTAEAMLKVRSVYNGYLHDPTYITEIEEYVMAGFEGDPDAIVELASKDKYDRIRIRSDLAIFLAEHGLKGNKEAMLAVPVALAHDSSMSGLADRIANQMTGEPINLENASYQERDNVRRAHASEIPVDSLVLLSQYDYGEKDVKTQHPLYRAYAEARAKDENGEMSEETREARNRLDEGREEIEALQNKRLFEAFQELKRDGVDAFKERYEPRPGWVDDNKGGLQYDTSARRGDTV